MKIIAIALALVTIALAPQEKESIYAFPKDEVQPYDVAGELKISFKGSHADFIKKGIDTPLRIEYRALFENAVVAVSTDGKPTEMERRVRTLKVSGDYMGAALKFDYDSKRPEDKRVAAEEGDHDLLELFRSWCHPPKPFSVTGHGKVLIPKPQPDQLMLKAGIMYWETKPDALKWITRERLAVSLLHHKIDLDFHNSFVKTDSRENRKLMIVEAKAELAGVEPPDERAPREISADPTYTASGGAKIEIDLTKGRMQSVKINVKVEFNGEAPVAAGGTGTVRGEVTFVESQVYKDK